jgi:PhnB protein
MADPQPYVLSPGTARAASPNRGLMLALLGTADPPTLRSWFSRLSEGGRVVDDVQKRPWGASDGHVIDRYGLHWLIGFEGD